MDDSIMVKNLNVVVSITKEDDTYIAKDIKTSVADQGDTPEEALNNLKEALELYYNKS